MEDSGSQNDMKQDADSIELTSQVNTKSEEKAMNLSDIFDSNEVQNSEAIDHTKRTSIKEEETMGGDLEIGSDELGQSTIIRTPTLRKVKHEPILWNHVPSAREEAILAFQELDACLYMPNYLGESGQDEMMSCDCKPNYDSDGVNLACGVESDCINRMTSIECTDEECNCGEACQNQRFQLREYADIDVFHAGKKGFGVRAGADFPDHVFVYEYVGEVIGEKKFRQRQRDYEDQGEKHFYFMMLQKGEYIDATRKGGLGRFINHSCEPNCYVDKWVVGNKLRMGIFTRRKILKGEELTFDYNVDRYGGDATPCYCGEPTCIGYIGGKTQTEAANKLAQNVVEALGLDDDDEWDDAKPKKNRRRKKGEEDEEYVNDLTPRSIREDDVPKIMGTLMQASERWLLRKLLQRIANDGNEKIQAKIVLLHGYQTLGGKLDKWKADPEICVLILQILQKWPSMTKNKISSSKIETYVKALAGDPTSTEEVKSLSVNLLDTWGNLEMAYRIPRRIRPAKRETVGGEEKLDDNNLSHGHEAISKEHRPTPSRRPQVRRDQPWRSQDHSRQRDGHRPHNNQTGSRQGAPAPTTPSMASKVDTVNQDLQAIIDAATKKQQEQAEQMRLQELQKAEDEAHRLAEEAEKRVERAKKHEQHKAAKEKRALDKRRKQKDKPSSKDARSKDSKVKHKSESSKPLPGEKNLERSLAKFIPNITAKFQEQLGKDQFKKRAKELVKLLVAKEMKRDKPDFAELSDEKKLKLRVYAKEFMKKVVARHASKTVKGETDSPSGSAADVMPVIQSGSPVESSVDDGESEVASEADYSSPRSPDSIVETNGHTNGHKRNVEDESIADIRALKRERIA